MVADLHKFLPWLVGRAAALPKPLQRTLGDRLVDSALDVLDATVAASYSTASARLDAIDAANRGVERLRHLMRGAHACKGISHAQYAFAAEALDGIGRQLGGWRRGEAAKA